LVLCFLSVVEIGMRVYDYAYPNCQFIDSDVFNQISFEQKREICNDNDKLVWNNNPLYLLPNQKLSTVNINSDGFRGSELESNPDYRIFLIGGSTMFGVGSTSDDSTIPSYLEQEIRNNFKEFNVEVINAGIPQAYSFTEKQLVQETLLNYEPDLLLIYDGWNDVDIEYENYSKSVDPKITDQIIRKIKQTEYVTLNVLVKLYFDFKHSQMDVIPFNSDHMSKKTTLWKNSMKNICELETDYNFKTFVMLQPILGSGNKSLTLEEQDYLHHYDGLERNKNYELYANELKTLNSECYATLDLRHVFDNHDQTLFFDHGHVGDMGNEIVAKRMFQEIMPILDNSINQVL